MNKRTEKDDIPSSGVVGWVVKLASDRGHRPQCPGQKAMRVRRFPLEVRFMRVRACASEDRRDSASHLSVPLDDTWKQRERNGES